MAHTEGIYLDGNATTPVDDRVVETMTASLREDFGNPSSLHRHGERAAESVAAARVAVARLVGAKSPAEIVFTSGGTEANNAAIHAALSREGEDRRLVLTSAIEHASVHAPLEAWGARGYEIVRTGLTADGAIDSSALIEEIEARGESCALVSVMWANNETGVLLGAEELAAISAACRHSGAALHVDGVQGPGKLRMDVAEIGADLVSISAHKFHGPKGIGALYVRRGFEERGFAPLLAGGAQERDRRAGTQNVAGIAGLGRAAALAREEVEGEPGARGVDRLAAHRARLERALLEGVPGCTIHGAGARRLPNTTNVHFPGVDGEVLLAVLAGAGLAASSGAACGAERRAPSHVLLAMGLPAGVAAASIRFSLSRTTSEEDVDAANGLIARSVAELQGLPA